MTKQNVNEHYRILSLYSLDGEVQHNINLLSKTEERMLDLCAVTIQNNVLK